MAVARRPLLNRAVTYRPAARPPVRRTTATRNYNTAAPQIVGPGTLPGGRSRIFEDPNDGNWLTPQASPVAPTTTAATGAAGAATVKPGKSAGYTVAGDPFLQLLQAQYGRDMGTDRAAALAEKKRLLLAFGNAELARKVLGQGLPSGLDAPLPEGFTRDMSGNGLFNWSANNVDAHGGMVVATRPDGSYSVVFQDRPGREGQAQGSSDSFQAFTPLAKPGPTDVMGAEDPFIKSVADNPFSSLANIKRQYETGLTQREDELNKGNLFYSGFRGKELTRMATERQQEEATRSGEVEGAMAGIDNQLLSAERQWQDRMFQAQHEAYLRELDARMAAGGDDGGGDASGDWTDNGNGTYSSWSPYTQWTSNDPSGESMIPGLIMPNDPRWTAGGTLPVGMNGQVLPYKPPKPKARRQTTYRSVYA